MSDYPAFVFRSEKGHDPDMCPWCDECAERARNSAAGDAQEKIDAIRTLVNESTARMEPVSWIGALNAILDGDSDGQT